MQGSHADHALASLLVCSTPVPTVGGQAATIDSPHDYNFSTDIAKPASDKIEGPSALPFISSASRGSTTTFDGSFSTLVGGSAAASTSPLAPLPLLCRSGQQPSCSLSSPPLSALAGDGGSDLKLSSHCGVDQPAVLENLLTCRSAVFTGEHTNAHGIAVIVALSDASTKGPSALSQRRRSRSPVPARQEAAPCEPTTTAASFIAIDSAAHLHSERSALTTIFERSAILSNNCGSGTRTQQYPSRQRDGISVHQRATLSVDAQVFAKLSAQALACEGSSMSSGNGPLAASSTACMHPTVNIATCAPAEQVSSTNIHETPGWVPGAPPVGAA